MINLILIFLLAPFLPVFFYTQAGAALKNAGIVNKTEATCANNEGGQVCGADSSADAAADDYSTGDKNPSDKKLDPKDAIFPVGGNSASGLVPLKINNNPDLRLWAGSSVAIDVETGTILHYDEGRKRTQIASLTKMMTAVLVMENIPDLNEEIAVPKEALLVPGTVVGCPTSVFCPSNRMYTGEKVKAIDLLKAMLMNSANDAATSLGIHIARSTEKFVRMMNDKALELGFEDTNFCTPSGLEIDGKEDQCYSSAYDIARIAAYSLRYDKIWEIMRIPEGQFYSCDGKYMHVLKNTDMLLSSMANCFGGKTGFTPLAGKSLLLGATDPTNKHKIIAVVLNDEKRWDDMKLLTDWIFKNYKWQ